MPDTTGLAGHAYLHGEVVSIPDCYTDARFNIEADRSTGLSRLISDSAVTSSSAANCALLS
eukprot:10956628-Alexandrium_andersonii.AAC.1